MTVQIPQRHEWDCGICCIAMMTGKTYEAVYAVSPTHYIQRLGMSDGMAVDIIKKLGFYNIVLAKRILPCLPGEPLMLAVPPKSGPRKSLKPAKMHYIFWDGDKILDPQAGREGKRFYDEEDVPGSYDVRQLTQKAASTEIIGLWVNERLSTRNGRDL